MAYRQLTLTTGEDVLARLANSDASQQADQTPNQLGTHFYAGGAVPIATTTGTDTLGIATQVWLSEVRISQNTLITGISYLIGSVGGTDKAIAILYDANGNKLAWSAL